MIQIIKDFRKLEDSDGKMIRTSLNVNSLKIKIEKFYNLLITRNFHIESRFRQEKRVIESIESLLMARKILEDCINLFKSNFELETNPYIQFTNHKLQSYTQLKVCLGIATSRLDQMTEKITSIERKTDTGKLFNTASLVWIQDFQQNLLHYMESFIISSLENAIEKFKNTSITKMKFGEKEKEVGIVKDYDLFLWFLFTEFYRVCEVEGSAARQSVNLGKTESSQQIEQKMIQSKPIGFPENVKYEESEDVNQFKDPIEEEL